MTLEQLDNAARAAGNYSVSVENNTPDRAMMESKRGHQTEPEPSLYPLILIVIYIVGTAALTTYVRAGWSWHTLMYHFMAGFFLVFSFFKLLDLRGFADAYQSYDIVAQRFRSWAFAYPFLELAFGVAFLVRWRIELTNATTLVMMLLGSAGVLRALLRKDRIRCACLGTALNLPMTTVTLVEDLGMAAMAAAGLFWRT